MATFEALGLRKYSKPNRNSEAVSAKGNNRQRGYLKEMLIQKFMTKNKLEIMGPANHSTREKEMAVQRTVLDEFDKFMKQSNFSQKNLMEFEKDLVQKIRN